MQEHRRRASAKLAARIGVTAVAACLTLAACGGRQSSTPNVPTVHFPVSITAPGGATVTIAKQPHRVVSLSPTATEMLFAIGAGSQVIAVDDQSNYPASAPITKLSGYQPNLEAIAGYAPDLVVAAEDLGSLVHGMQQVGVPILLEPAAKKLDDS